VEYPIAVLFGIAIYWGYTPLLTNFPLLLHSLIVCILCQMTKASHSDGSKYTATEHPGAMIEMTVNPFPHYSTVNHLALRLESNLKFRGDTGAGLGLSFSKTSEYRGA